MPNYIVQGSDLSSVASAIRTKGGTSDQLAFPSGFVSAIEALPSGGGELGNFELLNTISVSEEVSELSISIPSGYTQIALEYNLTFSGSTKVNFYHTSVAPSRELNASGTGTSKAGAVAYLGFPASTVGNYNIAAKTIACSSTDQLFPPIAQAFPPATIVAACNNTGYTITGGTVKIYGR